MKDKRLGELSKILAAEFGDEEIESNSTYRLIMKDVQSALRNINISPGIRSDISSWKTELDSLTKLIENTSKPISRSVLRLAFVGALENAYVLGSLIGTGEGARALHRGRQSEIAKIRTTERRAKANNWHKHADDLEAGILLKKPRISKDDLATEIGNLWQKLGFIPKHSTLVAYLRRNRAGSK